MTTNGSAERAAARAARRTAGGKAAWDKDRTRELFRRLKASGDAEARDQLIVNHINLVRFLASKFKNRGESLEDLIQVGTIGLIKAIDRFDPERGLEFTTYATPTIMGEIKRHFRDKGWSVRVPRRLQELSAKVNQATDELTNQLQRSPSVAEIAEHLGSTVDEVLELIEGCELERVFPVDQGNEERTRKAGLHLWYLVKFSEDRSVDEVIEKLSALGQVQDASPVRTIKRAYNAGRKAIPLTREMIAKASAASTRAGSEDPLLKYQWHLVNNGWTTDFVIEQEHDGITFDQKEAKDKFTAGADVNVKPVWDKDIHGDPSIIVAVLDEGVCIEHEDLRESIWVNENETWGSSEDGDGNGYAGDIYGYDFVNDRGLISWDNYGDTGHGIRG